MTKRGLDTTSLCSDRGGNVLPLAAMAMLVSAALIGGGIDMSRAYKAENRLQAACDAGVLAGRKAVTTNGFDSTAEAAARAFFNANFNSLQMDATDTEFTPSSTDNGSAVNGTATTTMDAVVMDLFGTDEIELSVDCVASMGTGNADITMVLDTTGSMAWTAAGSTPRSGETSRIQDLRAAMKNFYTTVSSQSSGSNTRIRYSFVPFSSSVNVGHLIYDKDPRYLVDSRDYQSRVWVKWTLVSTSSPPAISYSTTTQDNNWTRDSANYPTTWSYNTTGLNSCNTAKPANTSLADVGTFTTSTRSSSFDSSGNKVDSMRDTQPQVSKTYSCQAFTQSGNTKYAIHYKKNYRSKYSDYTQTYSPSIITNYADRATAQTLVYRQATFNTSVYKTFAATSTLTGSSSSLPSLVSAIWEGCIEERQSVADDTFTFVPGTGITPEDALDLDIDSAPDVADDTTKWAPMWPEIAYYRSGPSVLFSTSGTAAGAACPSQATLLSEMSRTSFDAYADALVAEGNTYHDLGMIWGARLSSPEGIRQNVVNDEPDNGGVVSKHMIYMTDGELNPAIAYLSSYGIERHDKRITGDGSTNQYERHRLRFLALCEAVKAKGIRLWVIAFGTGLTSDLSSCASDDSAMAASTTAALNTAFQNIANQVGELRVTQ